MKFKTTRKAIVSNSSNIVCAGYCDLYHLLSYQSPVAYTRGVYGWNFDVYEVNGLTICTGYRNMPGRRANNISEFEDKAKAIRSNWDMPYDQKQSEINELLRQFCEQA